MKEVFWVKIVGKSEVFGYLLRVPMRCYPHLELIWKTSYK
jgi:hypothetical protein